MNKVMLIGNLTKDPEQGTTANGIAYCKMSIAVNRDFADASGERKADFFNIMSWRGLAENCKKYLSKGKKIAVSGRVETRTYEQDGVKKYMTEIIADNIEFLTPKTEQGASVASEIVDEDLPF